MKTCGCNSTFFFFFVSWWSLFYLVLELFVSLKVWKSAPTCCLLFPSSCFFFLLLLLSLSPPEISSLFFKNVTCKIYRRGRPALPLSLVWSWGRSWAFLFFTCCERGGLESQVGFANSLHRSWVGVVLRPTSGLSNSLHKLWFYIYIYFS